MLGSQVSGKVVLMSNESYKNPTQIAFEKFRERVSKDQKLDADIVTAVLNDISSNDPRRLESLKKMLGERRQESSNDSDKNT